MDVSDIFIFLLGGREGGVRGVRRRGAWNLIENSSRGAVLLEGGDIFFFGAEIPTKRFSLVRT